MARPFVHLITWRHAEEAGKVIIECTCGYNTVPIPIMKRDLAAIDHRLALIEDRLDIIVQIAGEKAT